MADPGVPDGVQAERRTNLELREQVKALLGLIREFYTTCHMVAVGQLEPSKAKAKAQTVERQLSEMMARIVDSLDDGTEE
jgi:gas vesicle protein